ncbi:heparan-alpha-glucosaminide N-acetyltransferase domain-containing protein [Amycolatopsis sp. NPDC059021]|uniref:heparan-alpha-glucosaminide N-acetyltransferase domain-containing protein n=1 Tax=Amycolatopsis sp. NPDC059021 TaxID=3346704 RepID=UPI00366AB24D
MPIPVPVTAVSSVRTTATRLTGLDVARCVALVGMIGAHTFAVTAPELSWSPQTWGGLVHGRSSILFAVLGGLTLALISGRSVPVTGDDLVRARLRVVVRGALLFALGAVVGVLSPEFPVILHVYGVLFIAAVPFLSWGPRRLLIAAAVWTTVSPVLVWLLAPIAAEISDPSGLTRILLAGNYPALVWITFMFVGLAIGRLDLTEVRVQRLLVAWGAVASVVGYGGAWLASLLPGVSEAATVTKKDTETGPEHDLLSLLAADPHSGTTFEILGSGGLAVALIGSLLLLTRIRFARLLLTPAIALGSMTLTAYVLHAVSMAWLPVEHLFLWSVVVGLIAATVWQRLVGRGPLEGIMNWATTQVARRTPIRSGHAGR